MSRSQSGGRKKKPNKPPPANPLPNKPSASPHRQPQFGNHNSNPSNSNNQGSPPKIHAKSRTVMTQSSYNSNRDKPQRSSPVPPPRFNKGDTVYYQGQEAEVMKIVNQNQIEITYPRQAYIMQRHKAVVQPQELQVFVYIYFHTLSAKYSLRICALNYPKKEKEGGTTTIWTIWTQWKWS